MTTEPIVLAEHVDRDGVTWQARRSTDRGRLEVVALVPPRDGQVVVQRLPDAELQALLATMPAETPLPWVCSECGGLNACDRRWCARCSAHEVGLT